VSTSSKAASPFPVRGDRVAHGQYGAGTVTDLDVYHMVIDFDAHGPRRFVTNRVVVERTADPGPSPSERRATALRRIREERSRLRAATREGCDAWAPGAHKADTPANQDAEDFVAGSLQRVLEIAHTLPPCEQGDRVRRSLAGLVDASKRGVAVEGATQQLVAALHQLDESHVGGLRREFQRNVPAIGRVLETLQENVLPALRRSGFRV
jgi:hypothetical protein